MAKAFFDVDNTLIDGETPLIMFLALLRKKQIPPFFFFSWLFWLCWLNVTRPFFPQKNFALTLEKHSFTFLAHKKVDDLQSYFNEIFQKEIKPRLIPSTVQALREHQKRGDQVILLSASIYPLLQPLARYLKANRLIATELEKENGFYTGKVKRIVYGQNKFVIAEKEEKVSAKGNFFYSNSCSDLPCLEQVTYPVVVNPTLRLRRKAQEKGWPILATLLKKKRNLFF